MTSHKLNVIWRTCSSFTLLRCYIYVSFSVRFLGLKFQDKNILRQVASSWVVRCFAPNKFRVHSCDDGAKIIMGQNDVEISDDYPAISSSRAVRFRKRCILKMQEAKFFMLTHAHRMTNENTNPFMSSGNEYVNRVKIYFSLIAHVGQKRREHHIFISMISALTSE